MSEIYPILLEVLASGGEFRLYPKGVSMLPLIRPGKDSVILVGAGEPQINCIYLYRRANGQFVLHRLVGFEGEDRPIFRGDHQTALENGVGKEQIIAKVVRIYRKEKSYELGTFWDKCYLFWLNQPCFRWVRFSWMRIKYRLFHKK